MSQLRTLALLPALALLLVARGAAGHEAEARDAGRSGYAAIPLEAMSPGVAAAYLAAIQEELAARGYDPGPADGRPSPRTSQAILAYQRDARLPADGRASKGLLDHLKFVLPKVYARRAPQGIWPATPPRSPSAPEQVWPAPPPAPLLPPSARDKASKTPPRIWPPLDQNQDSPSAVMEQDSQPSPAPDAMVSQVQDALRRHGYYDGPVDGLFESETEAAVRRFQKDWGLDESGEIDEPLLAALLSPAPPTVDL